MLSLPPQILCLFMVLVAAACTPSPAAGERYEFLSGATICGKGDQVVRKNMSGVFGGGKKLDSIFVLVDSTESSSCRTCC